nr:hypothetical protein [Roseomonas mucosa]
MPALLILLALGAWFWASDPKKDIADWFWPHDAAPWEKVDAFYYLTRTDARQFQATRGLPNVESCQREVRRLAAEYRDPDMARGSYLCGVGFLQSLAPGVNVYRTTVR